MLSTIFLWGEFRSLFDVVDDLREARNFYFPLRVGIRPIFFIFLLPILIALLISADWCNDLSLLVLTQSLFLSFLHFWKIDLFFLSPVFGTENWLTIYFVCFHSSWSYRLENRKDWTYFFYTFLLFFFSLWWGRPSWNSQH